MDSSGSATSENTAGFSRGLSVWHIDEKATVQIKWDYNDWEIFENDGKINWLRVAKLRGQRQVGISQLDQGLGFPVGSKAELDAVF